MKLESLYVKNMYSEEAYAYLKEYYKNVEDILPNEIYPWLEMSVEKLIHYLGIDLLHIIKDTDRKHAMQLAEYKGTPEDFDEFVNEWGVSITVYGWDFMNNLLLEYLDSLGTEYYILSDSSILFNNKYQKPIRVCDELFERLYKE